jgi:hypothetical protein
VVAARAGEGAIYNRLTRPRCLRPPAGPRISRGGLQIAGRQPRPAPLIAAQLPGHLVGVYVTPDLKLRFCNRGSCLSDKLPGTDMPGTAGRQNLTEGERLCEPPPADGQTCRPCRGRGATLTTGLDRARLGSPGDAPNSARKGAAVRLVVQGLTGVRRQQRSAAQSSQDGYDFAAAVGGSVSA